MPHRDSATAANDKAYALARAVSAVARILPPDFAADGRLREAATLIVASGLEDLVTDLRRRQIHRLRNVVIKMGQLGRPQQTSEWDRHDLNRLIARIGDTLDEAMGRGSWEAADGELLGPLFEFHLESESRKRLGQYYTPIRITEYLLEKALARFDPRARMPFRLIDPACGAGQFLADAVEILFKKYIQLRPELCASYPTEPWDDEALIARVFRDHVVGVDIDPWAANLVDSRLRLKARALGANFPPEPQIFQLDALQRGADNGRNMPAKQYEAVVGNPPYGLDLSTATRAYVAQTYRLARGRYDSTALFIERGLELLAPTGRLAFVVPHGLTRTGAYAPCRDLLRREAQLVAVLDAGKAFQGVNLEAVGLVVEKNSSDSDSPIELATLRRNRGGNLVLLGEQEAAFFRERPTIPIYVPGEVGLLARKLERLGEPLASVARIRRGSPISARDPVLERCDGASASGVPVVRGRDIAPYRPLASASLLCLKSQSRLFEIHRRSILTQTRVGYQNIASGIVATLLPAGTLPLDTVNFLEPKLEFNPAALLAFLNSKIAAFYFRVVIANMAQLTVHLDTPTLGSLPVVFTEDEPLVELVRNALEATPSAGRVLPNARNKAVMAAIDAHFFVRFDLMARERAIVEEWASFGGRGKKSG